MRGIKRVLSQLHRYVLWALLSVFFWSWIFVLVTDPGRAHKVVLYASGVPIDDKAFAIALEEGSSVRFVQVHAFDYALFDVDAPKQADLWILPESELPDWQERLQPIPLDEEGYTADGALLGILLYRADGSVCRAGRYCAYAASGAPQNYYLCFNRESVHLGDWNGSKDDAAIEVAQRILQMEE